jgi:hypothetical protein
VNGVRKRGGKRPGTKALAKAAGCLAIVMIGLFSQSLCAGELRLPTLPSLPIGEGQYGVDGTVSDEAEGFVESSSLAASTGGSMKDGTRGGIRVRENGPGKGVERRKSERIDYHPGRRTRLMGEDQPVLEPEAPDEESHGWVETGKSGHLGSLSKTQKLGL